jgi:uncharacterized protein YndB with AHSA1/START domain
VITLVVRRTIQASAERLFDAWTRPEQLVEWWGPDGVTCIGATIDLRVGGPYRIGNRLPDGQELWIAGQFEAVDRPRLLRYSWRLDGASAVPERVTVRFEPRGAETEVIVTHERVPTETVREEHERGWTGCLDRLARMMQ